MRLVRIIKKAVFLSLFFLLASCGSGSPGDSGEREIEARFLEREQTVAATVDRFVTVPVTVNGVLGRFLLDTGSDVFLVTPAFSERAELPLIGVAELSTAVGGSESELRNIDTFLLGNVELSGVPAAVASLSGVDGAVGLALFEAAVVEVDYRNARVKLFQPPATRAPANGATRSVLLPEAIGFVLPTIEVNGQTINSVRVDTGSAGGLLIPSSQGQAILSSVDETAPSTVTTSNGSVVGTAFIADTVQLSGFRLTDQFVVLNPSPTTAVLLGNLILKQFVVTFDLPNRVIDLRRVEELRFELES